MTFYRERKRQKGLAEREAAGESLWTNILEESTRFKLIHALRSVLDGGHYDSWIGSPCETARGRLLLEEGLVNLAGSSIAQSDVEGALLTGDTDLVLSVLEALATEIPAQSMQGNYPYRLQEERADEFRRTVNRIFRADRFSAEMVGSEIIDFTSRELHVEVIAPALQLLANGDWSSVETAYQKAIREIDDDPSDAITDAGTALQEALLLCGAQGNSLGELAKSAKKLGVLAPHDARFAESLKVMIDWVSADRSERGDAHKVGTENRDDAWFAVHIVGALILRLSKDHPRGHPTGV